MWVPFSNKYSPSLNPNSTESSEYIPIQYISQYRCHCIQTYEFTAGWHTDRVGAYCSKSVLINCSKKDGLLLEESPINSYPDGAKKMSHNVLKCEKMHKNGQTQPSNYQQPKNKLGNLYHAMGRNPVS